MTTNTHRQAITTKFLAPTNCRGARVKATCEGGSITLDWDYALNTDQNHVVACEALQAKMGWQGSLVVGWASTGAVAVISA